MSQGNHRQPDVTKESKRQVGLPLGMLSSVGAVLSSPSTPSSIFATPERQRLRLIATNQNIVISSYTGTLKNASIKHLDHPHHSCQLPHSSSETSKNIVQFMTCERFQPKQTRNFIENAAGSVARYRRRWRNSWRSSGYRDNYSRNS